MTFNSLKYCSFLIAVALIYNLLPGRKMREVLLLIASLYFVCCWNLPVLMILVSVIVLSYFLALAIQKAEENKKKTVLRFSILICVLILTAFKYVNFLTLTANHILKVFNQNSTFLFPSLNILMPIGISFYLFQIIGYLTDVYRGKAEAEKNLLTYALFVSFFPKMAQGPIERSDTLIPQIKELNKADTDNFLHGLTMILLGLVKKVVIADRLAVLVDFVYADVTAFSGQAFWIASVFYTFQIYCDFSGYTDIAIGSARLFGIDLVQNFRFPYLATSISDFWRRWHISLSSWFRDYVYIPLGGNRVSEKRWIFNVMTVFLISGLWHGSAWNFVLWGGLHGAFQVIGKYKNRLLNRMSLEKYPGRRVISVLITFFLVNFCWILFRISDFGDLAYVIRHLCTFSEEFSLLSLGLPKNEMMFSLFLILFVIVSDLIGSSGFEYDNFKKMPVLLRWPVYLIGIFAIIMFGKYGSVSAESFIYFQF